MERICEDYELSLDAIENIANKINNKILSQKLLSKNILLH